MILRSDPETVRWFLYCYCEYSYKRARIKHVPLRFELFECILVIDDKCNWTAANEAVVSFWQVCTNCREIVLSGLGLRTSTVQRQYKNNLIWIQSCCYRFPIAYSTFFFSGSLPEDLWVMSNFSSTHQVHQHSGAIFRRVCITFRWLYSAPATFLPWYVATIFAFVISNQIKSNMDF